METRIGVGVGEYIEKEFSTAKESIWISTPTLTLSLTKKILSLAKKGIKIRIITSPRINPESEESNVLIRKSLSIDNKQNQSLQIDHKVVSNKLLPMVSRQVTPVHTELRRSDRGANDSSSCSHGTYFGKADEIYEADGRAFATNERDPGEIR